MLQRKRSGLAVKRLAAKIGIDLSIQPIKSEREPARAFSLLIESEEKL
jgi:hypothetical protein